MAEPPGRAALRRRIAVARGDAPADLVLAGARVADVFTGAVRPADVAVVDGVIAGVGDYPRAAERVQLGGGVLSPALIEAHVHVESTLLAPARFARLVAAAGTGTAVADPHEIANVAGRAGVAWMARELAGGPADVRLQAPPCVPATPLATTGAALDAADVAELLDAPGGLGLAELMDFPGAVAGEDHLLDKVLAAGGRPIDGHAPGLTGGALQAYAALGVSSDHESTTIAEAREKLAAGLWLMARSGSTAEDLERLLPLLVELGGRRCVLVNDDVTAGDVLRRGHLAGHLRRVVAAGLEPVAALRTVTLNAAELHGLADRGAIAPGRRADLVLFDDLGALEVQRVWHGGRDVAAWPAPAAPEPIGLPLRLPDAVDLDAAAAQADGLPAIGYLDGQLLTTRHDDHDAADALLVAIDRHTGGGWAAARVRGFGLREGALASTVAHDHHNLMVLGRDPSDMAAAIDRLRGTRGGLEVVRDGAPLASLPLELAGLMSTLEAGAVAERHAAVRDAARGLGCVAADPLMALSFLGLEVIPELKLTDRGLIDVTRRAVLAPR